MRQVTITITANLPEGITAEELSDQVSAHFVDILSDYSASSCFADDDIDQTRWAVTVSDPRVCNLCKNTVCDCAEMFIGDDDPDEDKPVDEEV